MQKARLHINSANAAGFALIDVLVSAGILILVSGVFVSAIVTSQRSVLVSGNRTRALFLAEEGLEAARNIRDANFTNLVDGTYGLSISANQYVLSGSQDTADIYTRTIQVKTLDVVTKQVISTVKWKDYIQGTVTLTTNLIDPTLISQATNLTVNTSGLVRVGLLGTSISGITATNTGTTPSTIVSVTVGGIVTAKNLTVAAGATVPLGTIGVPLVGGLLPITITLGDGSTKIVSATI